MTAPVLALALLTGALAVVDWRAVAVGDRRTEALAKPAVLAALTATAAVAGAGSSTAGRWLLVALLLGLVGDVALLRDSEPRFRLGLAAFLLGHLAYLACFAALGVVGAWWSWLVVAVLAAVLVATRGVVPAAHRQGSAATSVPVAVYVLVIGTMLVAAWATGRWAVALGAAVFVVSDAVLALDRFVRPVPRWPLLVTTTYHVGQALVVAGVLAG